MEYDSFEHNSFPYDDFHKSKGKDYFKTLEEGIKIHFGVDLSSVPGMESNKGTSYGVFQACKRIIKQYGTNYLWEKVQHIEAQTRMLSSLLLASVFNILLVYIAVLKNLYNISSDYSTAGTDYNAMFDFGSWIICSFAFTVVISYTFQYRRRTEVESIYSYTLLHLNKNQKE